MFCTLYTEEFLGQYFLTPGLVISFLQMDSRWIVIAGATIRELAVNAGPAAEGANVEWHLIEARRLRLYGHLGKISAK